jgi:RNA polymerase sigma-70 factor (ECF subfamily)
VEINERDLISRCIADERAAQEQLYRLHSDKMYSVCMYYAENRDEASDFLQEGYITVFSKLHLFKFQGSLEGWIRRVIVNTALGHIRKKRRFVDMFDSVEQLPDLSEETVEVEEVPTARIISLVNNLPTKAGLVIKLFAIEGYSHQEIAEILNITVGTSKSQLSRARTLLKAELENTNSGK